MLFEKTTVTFLTGLSVSRLLHPQLKVVCGPICISSFLKICNWFGCLALESVQQKLLAFPYQLVKHKKWTRQMFQEIFTTIRLIFKSYSLLCSTFLSQKFNHSAVIVSIRIWILKNRFFFTSDSSFCNARAWNIPLLQ